ncbi:ABC transporter ATP-binding protein [bacterium]|nr:ABC transporter ATP-binding protein [bacterium]
MENLIQLQQGSKSYGSKVLFDQASFSINEQEHVGVIGPNGAGKTTLFKALIGEESLDSGEIIRSRGLRLGYLSQHDQWGPDETIEEFISRGATLPVWELKSLGRGLGLLDEHYTRPIQSFSGGYRMRAKLLRMLGAQPNLMLLDEPTNYLDLETLLVLEKFLQGFDGAFLLISHDREFLRRTTDHIVEVEAGAITKFNGNIDDYFEQKEMLRQQLESRALSVEQRRKEVLDFVARFGAKATKARQAQSRLKSLDRLESIEVKALPTRARFRIPAPARTGKLVLEVRGAELGYPGRTVLRGLDLRLMGGEHLAVVGLNGAGKSTLLKSLAGRLPLQQGTVEHGFETSFAFFAQHVAEELNPDHTVLRSLQQKAHPAVLPQEILDLAGTLLFAGDDVQKPIRVLSGGEKSRVALGQVLLQKASCLLLDEPTNHLDFDTVESLAQALEKYEGSIVVVSHDRSFIRRIGTKILEVHQGRASTYPGSYDDYVWSVEQGGYSTLQGDPDEAASAARNQKGASSDAVSKRPNYKEEKKALDRKLKQLEQKIAQSEAVVSKNHERIAAINETLVNAPANSADLIAEMGKLQQELNTCETTWLQAADERERVLAEIAALSA